MYQVWSRFIPVVVASSLLLGSGVAVAQDTKAPATCRSTVSGDVRFHEIESRVFGNKRTIRVSLPPGYEESGNASKRYPVLYMLDGQNLFDACLSDVSHVEWGLDETVTRLVKERSMPPMIVVGVDHAGPKRAHEYIPYKDYVGNPDMDEPAGKRFPDFLVGEVMPLVNERYRTLRGQPNTGIGGSSYGGVATLYALLARPQEFGYGLIESPTLWIGMGQLVRDTSPLVALPQKVFVAFGGREGSDPVIVDKMVGLIRVVESNFRTAGYDESRFRFVFEPEAEHNETAWARRLPDALTFLFGDWKETPMPSPR
jgi:predicted alpha/beta superfamily hydrolase